jgi:hypothetical protein
MTMPQFGRPRLAAILVLLSACSSCTADIVAVSKSLRVDLVALEYPHDKPEGLGLAPDGTVLVSNDDDFTVTQSAGNLIQKTLPPAGSPDYVSIWKIRLR